MYDYERTEALSLVNPEIEVDGLDELMRAVDEFDSGSASADGLGITDQVFEYLATFLSEAEIRAFETAAEGGMDPTSNEASVWGKVNKGLLKHPALVGTLATMMGIELDEVGVEVWKNQGDCRGDKRFVSSGRRSKKEKVQLEAICEGCPVYEECRASVEASKVFKGFWAGKQRTDKNN